MPVLKSLLLAISCAVCSTGLTTESAYKGPRTFDELQSALENLGFSTTEGSTTPQGPSTALNANGSSQHCATTVGILDKPGDAIADPADEIVRSSWQCLA